LDAFGEMMGVRGALVTLQSLSKIKKNALALSISNQISHFEVATTTLSIITLYTYGA
jgi:hypothetical protein